MNIPKCGEAACSLPAHRREGDDPMHRARTDHVTPEEFHRYMKPWAVNPRPHRGDYAWMGVPAGQPEPAPVRWVVLGLSWLAVGGLAALAVVALLR